MVPPNHISLLIADGRRAKQWTIGLKREGLDVECIETSGSDAAKGDYWLVVPTRQKSEGQRFVSEVLSGKCELPSVAPVRGWLLWGAALIVLALAAVVAAGLFAS